MRSLYLLLAFLGVSAPAFAYPFLGVLVWVWLAVMTPGSDAWGFANGFPFNFSVAAMTIMLWVFSKKDFTAFKNPVFGVIVAFIMVFTLSAFLGEVADYSVDFWKRVMKVMMLAVMIIALINDRIKIHSLVWVLGICLGYFAFKAGLGTLLTGGNYHVSGPDGGPVADNNNFAAAMLISGPLLFYLYRNSSNKMVRYILLAVLCMVPLAVVGTYSRGGFIGLAALMTMSWLRLKGKFRNLILLGVLAALIASFMPAKYYERLGTIETASEDDGSFIGRLEAWTAAVNIAKHRIIGVGFRAYQHSNVFLKYNPDAVVASALAMHSIYFEVLADNGSVGLVLFLTIAFMAWTQVRYVVRATRNVPELTWAGDLARCLELSCTGYFVAGAALSLAYFEVYWCLIGIIIALRAVVARELKVLSPARHGTFAARNLAARPVPAERVAVGNNQL